MDNLLFRYEFHFYNIRNFFIFIYHYKIKNASYYHRNTSYYQSVNCLFVKNIFNNKPHYKRGNQLRNYNKEIKYAHIKSHFCAW